MDNFNADLEKAKLVETKYEKFLKNKIVKTWKMQIEFCLEALGRD